MDNIYRDLNAHCESVQCVNQYKIYICHNANMESIYLHLKADSERLL